MTLRGAAVSTLTITWVLLLVVSSGAAAQRTAKTYPVFATGKILRTWCLGKGAVRASCAGYLAGVVDSLRGRTTPRASSRAVCLPAKLAPEQVRLLFLNHMHRHPDRQGLAAAALVREALAEAFPCEPPPDKPGVNPREERISASPPPLLASITRRCLLDRADEFCSGLIDRSWTAP
jgi:hypothetical protein